MSHGPVPVIVPYAPARARFLGLAKDAGARLDTAIHPEARGPEGEPLNVDVAWLGPADAKRVFVAVSGMHGLEGPAGSAVQAAWLASGAAQKLPAGAAVCLVHALNPWGFAYRARGTENNVDLNRNFIDFAGELPVNPYYARIKNEIRLESLGLDDIPKLIGLYQGLVKEIGPARLSIAVNSGQYEDAEGLAFGGSGVEFGHRALLEHLIPKLAHAQHVTFIDWHTGVGAYGEVAFLPSGKPGTAAYQTCAQMWGAKRIEAWRRSAAEEAIEADEALIGESTDKSGQLRHWLQRTLPQAQVAGAVIEFGTEKPQDMDKLVLCTLYDRFLRFVDRGARTSPKHAWALDIHSDLFVPNDPDWRAMIVREGPALMDQAIAGLK
jgi:hypothetical protein